MDNKIWIILGLVAAFVVLKGLMGAGGDKSLAKEKIAKGARVIDVRTPGEYAQGHFEGAINIPLQELEDRIKDVGPTNQAIVVYCLSGGRSSQAQRILKDAGFEDVTNAGGLSNLR